MQILDSRDVVSEEEEEDENIDEDPEDEMDGVIFEENNGPYSMPG